MTAAEVAEVARRMDDVATQLAELTRRVDGLAEVA